MCQRVLKQQKSVFAFISENVYNVKRVRKTAVGEDILLLESTTKPVRIVGLHLPFIQRNL